jgi:hypothetical protein
MILLKPAARLWESRAKGILGWEVTNPGMPFFLKGFPKISDKKNKGLLQNIV